MSDTSSASSLPPFLTKALNRLPSHWSTSAFQIELIFRVSLGAYFVWFALGKMGDPNFFAIQISHYKLLPDPYNTLLALTLPWLELFAGLGLIFRQLYLGSLVTINGMLVVFIIAISTALVRGLDIKCGCSNAGGGSGLVFRLLVDFFALGVGVVLLAWASKTPPPAPSED